MISFFSLFLFFGFCFVILPPGNFLSSSDLQEEKETRSKERLLCYVVSLQHRAAQEAGVRTSRWSYIKRVRNLKHGASASHI